MQHSDEHNGNTRAPDPARVVQDKGSTEGRWREKRKAQKMTRTRRRWERIRGGGRRKQARARIGR
eukprot:scaffold93697_cov31-Tisochrysis_lutea.AAC.1